MSAERWTIPAACLGCLEAAVAEVVGVLLLPDPAWMHLLAEGIAGSRPPRAWRGDEMWFSWDDPDNPEPDQLLLDGSEALVLGWDGKAVEVGCCYVTNYGRSYLVSAIVRCFLEEQAGRPSDWLGVREMMDPLGALVLVDEHGQEVDRG